MNWVLAAILAAAVVIVIAVLIKLHLKKKLDSIDGLNGVHTTNLTDDEGTVIGVFGDEPPKK